MCGHFTLQTICPPPTLNNSNRQPSPTNTKEPCTFLVFYCPNTMVPTTNFKQHANNQLQTTPNNIMFTSVLHVCTRSIHQCTVLSLLRSKYWTTLEYFFLSLSFFWGLQCLVTDELEYFGVLLLEFVFLFGGLQSLVTTHPVEYSHFVDHRHVRSKYTPVYYFHQIIFW